MVRTVQEANKILGEKVASFFAEDGVIELPYFYSIGIEHRYQGHAKIEKLYDPVGELYPDFAFKPQDIKVLVESPDQTFADTAMRRRREQDGLSTTCSQAGSSLRTA
jgi:hypothetical protein